MARRELAFWVGIPFDKNKATVGNGGMVAFRASMRKQVDDFHAAALANGGQSEGAPGPRPHYAPDFYAAYARDPDGNKIAAVCRGYCLRLTARPPLERIGSGLGGRGEGISRDGRSRPWRKGDRGAGLCGIHFNSLVPTQLKEVAFFRQSSRKSRH